jgi:hypothetical protein
LANGIINRNKKGLILPFGDSLDAMKDPLLEFAKQRLFIPRAFREKMAERCSMVGMKTPVMDIGQRSRKSLGSQGIHNMNEMLDDRFREIKRQPQRHEKLVDSLMMC